MWCGCEDFPCCGHVEGGHNNPESAQDFLDNLSEDEREWAEANMVPCPECGEMRPKNDPSIRRHGCCYMCSQDPARRNSPQASANLLYFHQREADKDQRIRELEAEIARLKGQPALDTEHQDEEEDW